ncbi:MAG: alpha-mannosidase [Cyanobacteriota bacterium]
MSQGPDGVSWDLLPLWQCEQPHGGSGSALLHPWGARHRPDWAQRGLVIWPRGGLWRELRFRLVCPEAWRPLAGAARARLCLRWWADRAELGADGAPIHQGDLFDTACRWSLPADWWTGEGMELELRLRSPLHDDGALITSRLELEPLEPADPHALLAPTRQILRALALADTARVWVLGHAHLDLAWLWPVADTWQAAERTFASALALMERYPELHVAHSTPALYAWLERHRPALFAQLRRAVSAGRFEPINGPWVESDCVLVATASLLRQFQHGQGESQRLFPQLRHSVAWLPDSFGFGAGLPAVAAATGVRWFCTHKLAWNASNPFPHRLFRWRSRCGDEVLALMSAPIGTDGDPIAFSRYQQEWQRATGVADALWLPGVGDHGGGPTAEMLEQLRLWANRPEAPAQRHGTLRAYLGRLEPLAPGLPVWRDELYLELHRGCATSRPDQKRHNRTLERLLREAELAQVLARAAADLPPPGADSAANWEPLLFQQFHDILPGTSIPDVFEQAEPQWRQARRQARAARDQALRQWLGASSLRPAVQPQDWWLVQLQPLAARPITVRLPVGSWSLAGVALPHQPAATGGTWVQLPGPDGVSACRLRRAAVGSPGAPADRLPIQPTPLRLVGTAEGWRIANGLLELQLGPEGVEQLWDGAGRPQLAAPLALRRYRDAGEFWDAWDIAANYPAYPLPSPWEGRPQLLDRGPLGVSFRWRGRWGGSTVQWHGRLLAGSPWLECWLAVDWRQRHELLRLELALAQPASRWAADTPGGVIERPAAALNPREQARWELPAVSWLASVEAGGSQAGGLAVLLDGPQGVALTPGRLGVSLLRAPTWPDPGADNGWHRQRLALMPYRGSWSAAGVPLEALRLREPLWCRPAEATAGPLPQQGLPPLAPGLVLISARPDAAGPVLAVHNLSPCRRRFDPGPSWRLVERLDGLDQAVKPQPSPEAMGAMRPWELGFWRLAPG